MLLVAVAGHTVEGVVLRHGVGQARLGQTGDGWEENSRGLPPSRRLLPSPSLSSPGVASSYKESRWQFPWTPLVNAPSMQPCYHLGASPFPNSNPVQSTDLLDPSSRKGVEDMCCPTSLVVPCQHWRDLPTATGVSWLGRGLSWRRSRNPGVASRCLDGNARLTPVTATAVSTIPRPS